MNRFLAWVALAAALVAVLAVGVWYFGIPDSYVTAKIEGLGVRPYTVEVAEFKKGLLFTFTAFRLTVRNGGEDIARISDLTGSLRPLSLLAGRAVIELKGATAGGKVAAELSFSRTSQQHEVVFTDLDMTQIPAFEAAGVKGGGRLSGRISYSAAGGHLEFVLNDAVLQDLSRGGAYVPLKYFHTVRGAIEIISPEKLRLTAVSLEGKGIFARLKGDIAGRSVDLDLEVMPEPDFKDAALLPLIERYKISDGYYDIRIRTTL